MTSISSFVEEQLKDPLHFVTDLGDLNDLDVSSTFAFYRAMHYSTKRGLTIAYHLSVCPSECPSVMPVDQDHIGWKSWKLIARTISPTPPLFVAQRPPGGSWGNLEKTRGGVGNTLLSLTLIRLCEET